MGRVVDAQNQLKSQIRAHVDSAEFAALETISRKETKEELIFSKFREVMKTEPDQVLRFQRGGEPFWVSAKPHTVPSCDVCGGKRIFEFQVSLLFKLPENTYLY
ncbi:unnamed protein product [Dibothriocephalus latus]|uniref:Programmed cell death protein 2 C-terminal domain-containing protein n=1 Tax=Dibothriocephalus latus TaxID=60516 RepID=A0A3P7NJ69_DIBLA|nr:unnamed protein product [Dibothriocephalus latus]